MKVCFLTRHFPPSRCGVGDFVAVLARELADRCQVTVLTSATGQTSSGLAQPDGNWEVVNLVEAWGQRGMRALRRWLRQRQPDVVNLHYVPHLYGRAGLAPAVAWLPLQLRRMGLRVVTTLHELFAATGPLKERMAGLAHRLQLDFLVRGSDAVIVTTEPRLRWLQRRFPAHRGNIHLVPTTSTIPPCPLSLEERRRRRQAWGLEGALVLVHFGTFHWGRNLHHVASLMQSMQQQGAQVKLLCVGGDKGTLQCVLQRQGLRWDERMDASVVCSGYLPSPRETSWALRLGDVCVALWSGGISGRNTALLAALEHRLPLLGTRGLETDACFRDGENALLVEEGDLSGAQERLARLLPAEARRQVAERGWRLFQEHFSREMVAGRTLVVLGQVGGEREALRAQ